MQLVMQNITLCEILKNSVLQKEELYALTLKQFKNRFFVS